MTEPEILSSNSQLATIVNSLEPEDSRAQSPKKTQYHLLQRQLEAEMKKDATSYLTVAEMRKVQRKFDALDPFEIHEFINESENHIMRKSFMNALKKPSFLPRKAGNIGNQTNKSVSLDPRPDTSNELGHKAVDFLRTGLFSKKKSVDVSSKHYKLPRASDNLKEIDYDFNSYRKKRKKYLNSIILEPEPKVFIESLTRPLSPKTEYNDKILSDVRVFLSTNSSSRNSDSKRARVPSPWHIMKRKEELNKETDPRKSTVCSRIIEATVERKEEALEYKMKKGIPELVSLYFERSHELPVTKNENNPQSFTNEINANPQARIRGILKNSPNSSLERSPRSPVPKLNFLPRRIARSEDVNMSLDLERLEKRKVDNSPKQLGSNLNKFRVPRFGFKAGVKENLRYHKTIDQDTEKKVRFNQSVSIAVEQSEDIVKIGNLLNESLDFKEKVRNEKKEIQKRLQISEMENEFQNRKYNFVSRVNDKTGQMIGLSYVLHKKDEVLEKMEINEVKSRFWEGLLSKNHRELAAEKKKLADLFRITHIKNRNFKG